jgi:hypothetical protein
MPLLGKLSTNSIQQLLDTAKEQSSNATIHIVAPEHSGSIKLQHGNVVQLQHKQQNHETVLQQLLDTQEGHFLLYQGNEPEPHGNPHPILWLLTEDPIQRKQILKVVRNIGHAVGVIYDPTELPDLLKVSPPNVLIIDETLAEQAEPSLQPFSQATKLMILGSTNPLSAKLLALGAEKLAWPESTNETIEQLGKWLPEPSVENDIHARAVLELIAKQIPFASHLKVGPNPTRYQELQGQAISSSWKQWLLSLDPRQPLSHFLQHAPGPADYGLVLAHSFLQLGLLAKRDAPTQENPVFVGDQANTPPLQLHKVIAVGLRAQWQQDWIDSLKKISQNQALRIPREHPFPVPFLAKVEHARIPLRKDTLLVVYGARNEETIDQIVEQTTPHITGFLYFAEEGNTEELAHIQFMRKNLEARYQSRHIYMLATSEGCDKEELRKNLQVDEKEDVITLQQFDLHSTHAALQSLLQSFGK